jgi:ribosome biogenesis GTPase
VRAAVEAGRLAPERLANYRALQRELAYQARRHDATAALAEKRRWRAIHKAMRNFSKG